MKIVALYSRFGALCVALLIFAITGSAVQAQPAAETPVVKSPSLEELTQAELLRSYQQVREQLHATQLAVVNSRVEAETAARVQAAALTEKLEAIKSAMTSERERFQAEAVRLNAERERQQLESQRSFRTVLWVAAVFGGIGLIAMLAMPFIQWRAITRIADATTQRALAVSPPQALLNGGELSDQTVTVSNQRLAAIVDRMERRIVELEQTTIHPLPTGVTTTTTTAEFPHRNGTSTDHAHRNGSSDAVGVQPAIATDPATRITMLLGKARTLLTTNKTKDALACYDEILKLDANHSDALVKKGAALERLMRNEEAIRCYDRAIEVDSKMTLAYLYKGGVCNRLGRYDEALECYERALQAQEEGK
jgi:tetratricopeptide (TPR) repeat protein